MCAAPFFAVAKINTHILLHVDVVFFCLCDQALVGHNHNGATIWCHSVAECGRDHCFASTGGDLLYALCVDQEIVDDLHLQLYEQAVTKFVQSPRKYVSLSKIPIQPY